MTADGREKLPLKDVKKLALALDIDPADLPLVVLDDYMPETLGFIEDIVGSPVLSHNERKLVEPTGALRKAGTPVLWCATRER